MFLSNNKILEIFVSVKLFQSFDELKSSARIFGALTEMVPLVTKTHFLSIRGRLKTFFENLTELKFFQNLGKIREGFDSFYESTVR